MFKRISMIMLCASIALIGGVLSSWILEGTIKPLTMVLTALDIAIIVTMYKEELKELIAKIKGDDDDDFNRGNFG